MVVLPLFWLWEVMSNLWEHEGFPLCLLWSPQFRRLQLPTAQYNLRKFLEPCEYKPKVVMWSVLRPGHHSRFCIVFSVPKHQGLAKHSFFFFFFWENVLLKLNYKNVPLHLQWWLLFCLFFLSVETNSLEVFTDSHLKATCSIPMQSHTTCAKKADKGTQWHAKIQHLNKPRLVNFEKKKISDVQLSATHTQSQHVVFLFCRGKKGQRQGREKDVWTVMALLLCSRTRHYLLTKPSSTVTMVGKSGLCLHSIRLSLCPSVCLS